MSFGSKSPNCFCETSFNFEIWVTFDVFTIYWHGGHLDRVTRTVWTTFHSPNPWRLHKKFGYNWPNSFRGKVVWNKFMSGNIIFIIQGHVTLKWNIRSSPNSNWSEILCLSWIPASLKKLQSKLKALWARQHFPHYKFMGKNFVTQGLVTL